MEISLSMEMAEWLYDYEIDYMFVCMYIVSVNVTWLDLSMNYLHRRIDPKAYIVLHTHTYKSYAKKIFMKIF